MGGRYVFHHLILVGGGDRRQRRDAREPGRLGRVAGARSRAQRRHPRSDAGREIKAGSSIIFESTHLHSNGRDTKAQLRFGFKLHPKGYEPRYRSTLRALGNGLDIDIKPNEANQQLHAYLVLDGR